MKTRRKKSPQKSKTLQTTRYPRSSVTDNKDTKSMYLHNYKYIVIYSLESKQLVRWWKRYKSRALISSLVSRSCDKEPPSTQRPSLFDPTTSWTSKSPLPHFLLTLQTYSCIACCLRSEPMYQPLSLLHLQNPTLALSLPPSTHRSPILGDFCKAPRIAEISGWIFGSVFESVKFAETSAATRYFWRAGSGSNLSCRVILHVNIPLGNSRINT